MSANASTSTYRGLHSLQHNRYAKAYAASLFAAEIERDERQSVLIVPGTLAQQYRVRITRLVGSPEVVCDCNHADNGLPCSGMGKTVCYHSIAAVIYLAISRKDKKQSAYVCDSEEKADRLVRLGGQKIKLSGLITNTRPVWVVVKEKELAR